MLMISEHESIQFNSYQFDPAMASEEQDPFVQERLDSLHSVDTVS